MKKIKLIISLLTLTSIFALSSCVKDNFDVPDVYIPRANMIANMTIADFKNTYSGTGVDSIKGDTIIQGIVIGNDESGNIYKSLMIQDATGGIEIKLDATGLYNDYKLGQRVFVKCKGLYLGTYGGVKQLGYLYQGSIGRIPQIYIAQHLFKDSLPGKPIVPAVKKISTLSIGDHSTLVRFDSVTFVDGGLRVFCDQTVSSADDRIFKDADGQTVAVRTSKYSNFASMIVPSGMGSVVGVMSEYNGTKQLYVRDTKDLIGFVPDPNTYLLNEPFATSLGSFTQVSVLGNEIWGITQYGLTMSGGFPVSNINEDWLISPSLNLDLYNSEVLKFETAMKYGVAGDGSFKVYYSSDYVSGDPTQATWTELIVPTLSTGNFTWTGSGNIDLSAAVGTNIRIGIKYTCGTSNVPTWEIRSLLLKGVKN